MADVRDVGIRLGTGQVSVVAAATTTVLHPLSAGKRAVIKKICWMNRAAAGNTELQIGYLTVGAVFTQVLPDIQMIANIDGQVGEEDLPSVGNGPEGFAADTTLVTGTLGNIVCQCVAAGAAPNDVLVALEVEEI